MAVTKTSFEWTASSSLTQTVPFEVITAGDIDVYVEGVLQLQQNTTSTADATHPQVVSGEITQGTALTNYTVASNNGSITFNANLTVDDFVVIERTTDDTLLETFTSGSTVRARDLNSAFERVLFIAQEGVNIANEALAPSDDEDDALDAKGERISNVADATDDDDAVNRAQLGKVITDDLVAGEGIDLTDVTGGTNSGKQVTVSAELSTAVNPGVVRVNATTPITATYTNPGQLDLSIENNSIDIGKIQTDDIITLAEQNAGSPNPADTKLFTSSAAAKRFDTLVQTSTPTGSDYQVGKTWLQNDDELTLSIWNGNTWTGIASGGTFTNQPKVVYVDASSGDDNNDGHRISRPKLTIKAAVNQINNDATYGDGSVVIVAPGVYQEALPIQIEKKNVSIIGNALRSCIVHPTVATQESTMFELNSGSYIANLTLTGMKASGSLGNSVDAVLPTSQGWNFAFYNNAVITKSPYIQNCTNFSDSEIDNSNLNANTPAGGLAGDTDSAPTGGGLLVDGSVPAVSSPLRSIVCDSYTHVGLNGPGILVTNNGYVQATSSYAFFNRYHIKCLNGGQANLAASTTDFGDQALVADGKSTTAIFTANTTANAAQNDITFTVGAQTAGSGWFGDTTRPGTNMLVELGGTVYPILSAVANGSGWDVTISRPDPSNRSTNLGLDGAVTSGSTAEFFLRSMIASSGHTMEYVGSGTDYRALPENGGVPDETKQITELNDGKVWTAITDHNGKFKIGGNQTDDPIFEVDQQLGFVTIPEGSIAFNLLSDLTPQLGGDLDVNGNTITGLPTTPTSSSEATSKAYVDAQIAGIDEVVEDTTPQLGGNLDLNSNNIDGTGNIDITGSVTASANSEVNGVSIGRGAGDVATNTVVGNNALDANTTGSNNTAIGDESLTANTDGAQNVAVGAASLNSSTSGNRNIAIGYAALNANTTGDDNVAVGKSALAANTTADDSTAVGSSALAVSTGAANTAVGKGSLDANTTGASNVGVGAFSLSSNTTASNNVALGRGTLEVNTTGSENTAVGAFALDANTTASNNTAVGYNAATANTTGTSHVAVGLDALKSVTTANSCTAIGRSALQLNTAANNTALGAFAADANTSGSDIVAVGYDALSDNTTGAQNTAVGHTALTNNTTGTRNVAVGSGALFTQTDSSYNTGVGYGALYSNTGTQNAAVGYAALLNSTASYNSALGYNTLGANTTGSENTALGRIALQDNTEGSRNTAVGSGSLENNTTANDNTAVGRDSLKTNTTGYNNTAVGSFALTDSTANNNTAVGKNALKVTTSGGENTAVGTSALDANTTGQQNTAVGYDALTANTTANNNVAVGYNSMGANTTGTQNVAMGYASLDANTTASNNTAVGYNALTNNTASDNTAFGRKALNVNTTGTQNVAVGAGCLDSCTTGVENTAVGFDALSSVTTNSGNTAVGRKTLQNNTAAFNTGVGAGALQVNTSGAQNVAVGALCLDANTTGGSLTAVGYEALTRNTTGYNSTAVGREALAFQTTGYQNTAYGYTALQSLTTGYQNTAVGNEALQKTSDGNVNVAVGIHALEENTTGSYNVAVGGFALDANTTASNNTAIGREALGANTTGTQNTAGGASALDANTTGYNNTAFGYNSSSTSTSAIRNASFGAHSLAANSASHNTAIGYEAMYSNTSGSENTAVGAFCMDSNTTGQNNVGVGYAALDANTTGQYNTAVGSRALDANTIGNNNTATGFSALGDNTTGNELTAFGYHALSSNTTGSWNTAFGRIALDNVTTGGQNVGVGYHAGGNITTGSENICIGQDTGNDITTGSDNIIIGDDAQSGSGASSHRIVLGVQLTSAGDNTFAFGKANNRVYNVFTSNASWTRDSDVRLKKDIQTNTDLGLDFINDLRTVTYKWKAPSELDSSLAGYDASKTEADYTPKMYGFIAQEVKQALDDHNVTDFNGWHIAEGSADQIQGISYEMFVMPLVKAVQELSAENTALKARLDAAGI